MSVAEKDNILPVSVMRCLHLLLVLRCLLAERRQVGGS